MKYEIRAMSFGEILDTGFQLLRNHFGLLVGLSLVIYAPVAVLSIILAAMQDQILGPLVALGALIPLSLALLLAAPIVSAAITYAVGQLYLGEEASFEGSLRAALSITVPLVGTSFLSSIFVGIGLLFFILPGIYLLISFLLLGQVMVLERVFGVAAMRRSHALLKGSRMRALGVLVVGGIIVTVLSTGLQLVLTFVPLLGSLSSAVAQAIGSVYTTAISVVLYFDIRCRKEAFDLEHLARLVQGHRGVSPSATEPLVR